VVRIGPGLESEERTRQSALGLAMDQTSIPERDAAERSMRAIERRLVDHLAGDITADFAPTPMRNSMRGYTDPAWLAREHSELFGKLPILACLSGDVPNPGDITLFEAYGPSIIIARAPSGEVNAFLNMCTHRAGRLVNDCSRRKLMTCSFHSWSFDLEGRLVGLPNRAAFAGIDMAERRLIRVPVGEWGGMIFVKLHPGDERIDVAAWLGELGPELLHCNMAGARMIKSDQLDIAANWKYKIDTFGEGYHFNAVHPETFAVTAVPDLIVYDHYEPHYRISFANKFYKDWIGTEESTWPVTPYRSGHFIFPNTFVFSVYRESTGRAVTVYQLFPQDRPDRARTRITTYRLTDTGDHIPDSEVAGLHDFTVSVIGGEDYPVAEASTRNLMYAPADFELIYGRNEVAIQNFQRSIARMIGEPVE
jgi:phenylpropionate dioxygenase-like ring-hydroxylating dioxygenase large terminal subunit